jgi:hypothetical protein
MKLRFSLALFTLLAAGFCHAGDPLANVKSSAEVDAAIGAVANGELKKALQEQRTAILAAIEQRPHAEAVAQVVEGAHGKVEKVNLTPESLKSATGGDLAVFDTLKLIDLAVPNTGPHDKRTTDPYDAAFFEHIGRLISLESLNIISTKLGDDWIAPLARLTNLKTLRFTNNGKLTDAGLEKLAGLKNMEAFSFVGTAMTGHAFAKFDGWMHLTKCSFRGSSIDDEGLKQISERFPNLESISLAHAKFTDAGAPNLAKLTKLKSLELGAHASPNSLKHLVGLPLESLQLGEGFDSPESLVIVKDFKPLKRLTLTNCSKTTDNDIKLLATMKQLESLELGNLPMTEERVAQLKPFTFLKTFRLVQRPQAYPEDLQAKIKAEVPGVDLKFE